MPSKPLPDNRLGPSRYNHVFLTGGRRLGFQGRTGAVVSLDDETARILDKAGDEPLDPGAPGVAAAVTALRETGFLVSTGVDEVLALRRLYYLTNYGAPELNLVIAPTLACNLSCSYCFEAGRGGDRMKPDVAAAIPSFVAGLLDRVKLLRVTWYGGEPLLALDLVEDLTRVLRSKASEASVTYEARIVTNGTLLTSEVASKLADLGVTLAQVTLDGPAALHDSRRLLRGGGPTWNRIVGNIAPAAEHLGIVVRMTLGSDEARFAVPLCEELDDHGLPESVLVFPAPLDQAPLVERSGCSAGACQVDDAFLGQLLSAGLVAAEAAHPRLRLPAPDPVPACLATSAFGFAVAPNGSLHRCLETVGDDRWAVGSLTQSLAHDGNAVSLLNLDGLWSKADPFLGGECPDCLFLPQCFGGCPKAYLKTGRRQCTPFRSQLVEWVKAVAGCG